MSKVIMGNGGFYCCLSKPQGVSAWWKETAQTRIRFFSSLVAESPWTSIKQGQTLTTHNTKRHCRVRFYTFVGHPLSKQLYMRVISAGANKCKKEEVLSLHGPYSVWFRQNTDLRSTDPLLTPLLTPLVTPYKINGRMKIKRYAELSMGPDSSSPINLSYLKLPRWRSRCRFPTPFSFDWRICHAKSSTE